MNNLTPENKKERRALAIETLCNMLTDYNCVEDGVQIVEAFSRVIHGSDKNDLTFKEKCDDVRALISEIKTDNLYE